MSLPGYAAKASINRSTNQPNTPPDCSSIGCPPGKVCRDCTIRRCTTAAQCRRECSQ